VGNPRLGCLGGSWPRPAAAQGHATLARLPAWPPALRRV